MIIMLARKAMVVNTKKYKLARFFPNFEFLFEG